MDFKTTLARGARQLVVQLALETISSPGLYSFSFTPTTNIGASLLGAEITTFLAPPWSPNNPSQLQLFIPFLYKTDPIESYLKTKTKIHILLQTHLILINKLLKKKKKKQTFKWAAAFSLSVKTPVGSTTKSAPAWPHGISSGFL